MENFFIEAVENFARAINASVGKCEKPPLNGYISSIKIEGDINYLISLLIPKGTLDTISMLLFGEDEYDMADLTNEIANLIVGNVKVIAGKKHIDFNISIPEFLSDSKVDYDKRSDLSIEGECFSILYKEN